MSHYGVVFHKDGTVTVLNGQTKGRFEGSTRALNQANRACGLTDTYSAVEASNKNEAIKLAQEWADKENK